MSHYNYKQVIVVRKDLNMRKGKIAAQAGHGVLNIFLDDLGGKTESMTISLTRAEVEWIRSGAAKICVSVDSEAELDEIYNKAGAAKIARAMVVDRGYTEFAGVPTKTVVVLGPALEKDIDPITGHLKLL